MNRSLIIFAVGQLTLLFSLLASAAPERPNIIFILLDDLGKEWVGCYGAEGIETPHIDRLAATGMKFVNAYSMPQCTPSRACFLTGQYPFRNGWVNHWDVPRWGLGYFDWQSNPSIGRVMREAGYKTAAAGKWQLNDFRIHPKAMVRHGFDEYCMWTGGETDPDSERHTAASDLRYWDPYIHTKAGSRTYPGNFGPDLFNQFLLEFISACKDNPFFIYYAMVLPHTPFTTTPHNLGAKTALEKHKSMVRYSDYLLGRLVDHLAQQGLSENTLIVWTSDNGSTRSLSNRMNGRIVKGGKMETTENGVNAPFIVNWPGHVPAGEESMALVDFTDLLPTFADLAETAPEASYEYDGQSLKNVFLGEAKQSRREWIMAMGGWPAVGTEEGIENVYRFRDRVIRDARYKLFVGTDREAEKLFDLVDDPEEANNLLEQSGHTESAQRLSFVIEEFPLSDQDPIYRRLPGYPIYREGDIPSESHKK